MVVPEVFPGEMIGCGHFGNVFRGKSRDNMDVAIKMVKDKRLKKEEFLYEAKLLSLCNHENVLSLKDSCFESKPYWIMVEFMGNGNLKDFLSKTDYRQQSISTSRLIRIVQEISKGMVYLSTKLRIVHRDLAARNVLLDSNLHAKISDFGLARQLPIGNEYYGPDVNFCLPLRWSAPEVVTRRIFSFKSDVWSFGIILFEISSRGQKPFGKLSINEIYPSIIQTDSRDFPMLSELPLHFPTELENLMHSCWAKNESGRPTFSEIFVRLTSMIPVVTSHGTYTYSFWSNHKNFRIAAPNDYYPTVDLGHHEETKELTKMEMSLQRKRLQRITTLRPQSYFTVSSQIGRGHFGEIFYGETIEGEDIAIKTIRLKRQSFEQFLNEAELLAQFNHKNVTSLLAVVMSPNSLWIITEFMENADLTTFLVAKESKGHVFPVNTLIGIAQQVAIGMDHISSLRIIHKDLAARNVLVGPYQKGSLPLIKITDFGLSHQLAPDQEVYKPDRVAFSVRWSAPEIITEHIFSLRSDVWAFGMTLYEVMTHGQIPFKGISHDEIFRYIVSEDSHTFPMLSNPKMSPIACPASITNLMIVCWNKNKKHRPTFSEIVDYFDQEYSEQFVKTSDCVSCYDSCSASSTVSSSTALRDIFIET